MKYRNYLSYQVLFLVVLMGLSCYANSIESTSSSQKFFKPKENLLSTSTKVAFGASYQFHKTEKNSKINKTNNRSKKMASKAQFLTCDLIYKTIEEFEARHINLKLPNGNHIADQMSVHITKETLDKLSTREDFEKKMSKSLFLLKVAILNHNLQNTYTSYHIGNLFNQTLSLIESKMKDRDVYLTKEEFLKIDPGLENALKSHVFPLYMEKREEFISYVPNSQEITPDLRKKFNEDFFIGVLHNFFRAIYFRKQVLIQAETKNLMMINEPWMSQFFLKKEIEDFKKALSVSQKFNLNFLTLMYPFSARIDEDMRKEVCEDIYKSYVDLSQKIYDRVSLFEGIIQEISQVETIKQPQQENDVKEPTSIEELKASYKNQIQNIIYERISNPELTALGEDSKSVQKKIISDEMSTLESLKKTYNPNRNESSLRQEAYFQYINSVFQSADIRSSFHKDLSLFKSLGRENYGGLGITVSKPSQKDPITIMDVFPNGPGSQAGLKREDHIIQIKEDSENSRWFSSRFLSSKEFVDLAKGKAGTKVYLEVKRKGEKNPLSLTVIRGSVEIPRTVAPLSIFEVGKKSTKVGVLRIPTFNKGIHLSVKESLREAQNQGVQSLVIDLTGNPGGLMREAILVTGLFINSGLVVSQNSFFTTPHPHYDLDPSISWKGPMTILTDKLSASGSEVMTGALKDYNRTLVVGDTETFGKFSIQNVYPFKIKDHTQTHEKEFAIKFTTQLYATPKGLSLQNQGVPSHFTLKLTPKYSAFLKSNNSNLENYFHGHNEHTYLDSKGKVNSEKLWTPITESVIEKLRSINTLLPEPQTEEEVKNIATLVEQKVKLVELGKAGYKGIEREATFHDTPMIKEAAFTAFQLYQALEGEQEISSLYRKNKTFKEK